MKKNNTLLLKNNIEYYYKKNRFLSLFFDTKKYKDLFLSKEALGSFLISALMSLLIYKVYNYSFEKWESLNETLINIMLPGLLGLLGFIIGGMAIMTGGFTKNVLKNINEENKFNNLINIMFEFYMCAALIGIAIVLLLIEIILLYTNFMANEILMILLTFVSSYIVIFTLIYSIMLTGTCLRVILLIYKFDYEHNEK